MCNIISQQEQEHERKSEKNAREEMRFDHTQKKGTLLFNLLCFEVIESI